jgi:hypothetical protein
MRYDSRKAGEVQGDTAERIIAVIPVQKYRVYRRHGFTRRKKETVNRPEDEQGSELCSAASFVD